MLLFNSRLGRSRRIGCRGSLERLAAQSARCSTQVVRLPADNLIGSAEFRWVLAGEFRCARRRRRCGAAGCSVTASRCLVKSLPAALARMRRSDLSLAMAEAAI